MKCYNLVYIIGVNVYYEAISNLLNTINMQHISNNYCNVIYTTIKAGLGALGGCVLPGIAGAVFLHPDFGIDKQNKLFRKVHKYASRALLMLAWCATISGLKTLVGDDIKPLIMFAAPLVIAAPFTLM